MDAEMGLGLACGLGATGRSALFSKRPGLLAPVGVHVKGPGPGMGTRGKRSEKAR